MLDADQIAERLQLGYEKRGLELKGPGARSNERLLARVAKAALGLGNLRDGGHIIIGIDDESPERLLPGLEPDDLASWTAYDDLARKLDNYADPPIRFDVAAVELSSGATVAVIEVFEFADIPHFCAKEVEGILNVGKLYVRPRKVPETSELASAVELRDLIGLTTEKALRTYVETAARSGLTLGVNGPSKPRAGNADSERFEAEAEKAWE